MSNIVVWLLVAYALGGIARAVYPYILKMLNEGVTFNWRYLVGQVLGVVAGVVPLLGVTGFLEKLNALSDLGWYGYVVAFVYGAGAASIGRNGQKTVHTIE